MRSRPARWWLGAAALLLPTALLSAGTLGAQAVGEARTAALRVAHAAFDVPAGAPDVVVHVPGGFRPDRPYGLVIFLHGWQGCAQVLVGEGPTACREGGPTVEGWGLGAAHDAAGTNTILLVPQLAFLARDGSAGRLTRPGQARALIEEAIGAALGPDRPRAPPARVVLVAHSAGYETALAVLRQGRLAPPPTDVVLMDALYAGTRAFADWVVEGGDRRLVTIYTSRSARPGRESLRLWHALRRRDPDIPARRLGSRWSEADARGARLVVAASSAPHRDVPAVHLAETLRGLELPLRNR